MASSDYSPQRPSGQRPTKQKPAESAGEQPASPIRGYTDEEARDIYARAADIQSQTTFEDDRLTPEMLQRSANRAGISDAALEQAIKEREQERFQLVQSAKLRARQKSQLTRQLTIGAVALALISGGATLISQGALSSNAAKVEAAQAQVDNVLERRHNLIPNLISVTKSTLDNERALIEKLSAADTATRKAVSPTEKLVAETQLSEAISQTLGTLKSGAGGASPVVLRLSDEMAGSENRLAVERRKYNLAAAAYNRVANVFPTSLTRRILGYRARYDYFQASSGAQETPKF